MSLLKEFPTVHVPVTHQNDETESPPTSDILFLPNEQLIFSERLSHIQRGIMLADALSKNSISSNVIREHQANLEGLSQTFGVPSTVEFWQNEVKPIYTRRVNELFNGFYPDERNVDIEEESHS